ncbi:hypothetical protein TrCOL_g162 [Triparma columacea]|uniref:ethanolamine-phosphate cytidylyltransferase n=1 Tax=Triparma columacea TaxID=722753 RepID=A0A9W7GLP9_9STRA|nr:hypothetical protein TrCOL_g162 [Triparma columacea]
MMSIKTLLTENFLKMERLAHSLADFGVETFNSVIASPLTQNACATLSSLLTILHVPSILHPSPEHFVTSAWCTFVTLTLYYGVLGRTHMNVRKTLRRDLKIAADRMMELEEKLLTLTQKKNRSAKDDGRPIRIFMDGAFDMMHYGHMNAFRQGKSLGTHLIVGVNSDESITRCKGPPVMNDQERLTAVEGCKFVDEVIPACPYVMTGEYLDYVIEKYKVDYVVHGDDACIVDGKDVYESAKKQGMYQSIPRTDGVSTTDIVGRMLLMTKDHHKTDKGGLVSEGKDDEEIDEYTILGYSSKFLTTSRMLRLFSAGVKAPDPGMKIIYMDGSWDMFHAGHISILKEARARGDYLIVGVHSDVVVNKHQGSNLPIMNLHERVLSVLGCKFVDDVLIDAPYVITPEMIASLKIDEVVRGNAVETDEKLRYNNAMKAGVYHKIESPSNFKLSNIKARIAENQRRFEEKIEKKKKKEQEYYDEKYGLQNGK